MRVLFAPDYRAGNRYQSCLAEALESTGKCQVSFPSGYRRGLPLTRASQDGFDLLHLHWPEAYCHGQGLLRTIRQIRLPWDLRLCQLTTPYVVTAHNLWPHHLPRSRSLSYALSQIYQRAERVIAHSSAAAQLVADLWKLDPARIQIIPHGNLAEGWRPVTPTPISTASYALNFGALAPYKGLEELINWWKQNRPALTLRIAGPLSSPDYIHSLQLLIGSDSSIQLTSLRLSDDELNSLIHNAAVIIINHVAGLTSGVANLSRSLGTHVLLPERLTGIDLMEPHPGVFRFDTLSANFADRLHSALKTPRQPPDAKWLACTSWSRVAQATISCYESVLNTR